MCPQISSSKSFLTNFTTVWLWNYKPNLIKENIICDEKLLTFSLVCVLSWLFNVVDVAKALLHILHWYGRSPVCCRICVFKWVFCLNDAWHTAQMNGLWPVCSLKWPSNVERCVKVLLQASQMYSLFGLWTFKWDIRSRLSLNEAAHWLHTKGRSPVRYPNIFRWSKLSLGNKITHLCA